MKKRVLIFSGNNDRAIVTFCRFAVESKIDFTIIANGKDDLIFKTYYKQNISGIREFNKIDIDYILNQCKEISNTHKQEIFILPSNEYLNRILIENSDLLSSENITFGLCDKKTYETFSNKFSFGNLCKNYNIPIPKEYDEITNLPTVIKPKYYKRDDNTVFEKPLLIFNKADLTKIIKNYNSSDYYYQEYVEGESYYLLLYVGKDKRLKMYSQQNLLQQENGRSMMVCKSSDIHRSKAINNYQDLLLNSNFFGLIMIEVIKRDNELVMIEANPRLWGPSQLILDSGMELFHQFAIDNELMEKNGESKNYKLNVPYFWKGGFNGKLNYEHVTFHKGYSQKEFENELSNLNKIEIYNKEDTINIYKKEEYE